MSSGVLIVVAGTGTEVGKTWVAQRLASAWRDRSLTVQARKPVQSFAPGDPADGTDAALLGGVTGEDPTTVCPPHRWYPVAMAPPMAADVLGGGRLVMAELVDELTRSWGDVPADVGLVELAGGLWSPIAHDGDGLDLTAALAPDRIALVADAGLGTINSIRPAVAALAPIAPVTILLNRFGPEVDLHRRNMDWLRHHDQMRVVTSVRELADDLIP